jgi:TPR repeat protein
MGSDRLMRFYIDGQLDAVVEVVGDVVANAGPLFVGRDMSQPGLRGFVASVHLHSFALEDEDVQQAAATAMSRHSAPDFDGEPEREARLTQHVDRVIDAARHKEFQQLMEDLPPAPESPTPVATDATECDGCGGMDGEAGEGVEEEDLPEEFVSGGGSGTHRGSGALPSEAAASSDYLPSSVPELEEEEALGNIVDSGGGGSGFTRSSFATSTLVSTREKYANEQYRLGEDLRVSSLTGPEDDIAWQRIAAVGLYTARKYYALAAAAGHPDARRALATMYDGGYGVVGVTRQPARALYHRLRAAAAGDPGAQLALGTAHLTARTTSPRAACPVALYYLFHAATTANERNSMPGGQARVEQLRLFEGVARERGDHKGESDDRMMYLRQSAELGDWRAMLGMANGYYWGNFGIPRDLARALNYYQRAHDAGALQGTVGVAKMSLKGEGAHRNLTKALDYYNAAANRSSADALNGLGYIYYYGSVDVPKNVTAALSYFRRAADLDNNDGIANTGLMLRQGLGAPRNLTAAHQYFVRF